MAEFLNELGAGLVNYLVTIDSSTAFTLSILIMIFYSLMWQWLTEGFHWRMTKQVSYVEVNVTLAPSQER